MRIYIAHNLNARDYLNKNIIPFLESKGHEVTSRWIKNGEGEYNEGKVFWAIADLEDVDKASILVLYVDQFGETPGKGKWFEFGYALRAGKRIILIGEDRTCVFTYLPNIRYAKTIEEAEKLF